MRDAAASRVASDLCFFDLLFCLVSPVTPRLWVLALLVAACLVFGSLASRTERRWLRLLLLLPPLAAGLLAPDTVTRLAVGMGWIYFALLFALDRAGLEYWTYRRVFPYLAGAALLISLYLAAATTLTIRVPRGVLGFAALFAVLGVHTLRALRMGAAVDPAWKAWSILELLIPGALGGGLFALLRLLFLKSGRVFELLLAPVFWLIRAFSVLMSLLVPDVELDTSVQNVQEITDQMGLETVQAAPGPTAIPAPKLNDWMNANPFPWRSLWMVLGLLAAAAFVIWYVLRGRAAKRAPDAHVEEERFSPRRSRRRRMSDTENDARIRELYRSYLLALELHGRPVRSSDTSADVLSHAEPETDPAAERELRELYLTARYGDGSCLGKEDVRRAEALLETIRNALS